MLRYQWSVTAITIGALTLISVAVGWWLAGRLLNPRSRIADTARRLSLSSLHERIALAGPRNELIALGLAVGVGLVITVMGASSGVAAAQAQVLQSLYGIGTDITVTRMSAPLGGTAQPGQVAITLGLAVDGPRDLRGRWR